jgi:acylphosphatase
MTVYIFLGVSFRKYALAAANEYQVRGWCRNTEQGTVKGHLQGPESAISQMKNWLANTGSPYSKIEKAQFGEARQIQDYEHKTFTAN